jgi:hypothetical protein
MIGTSEDVEVTPTTGPVLADDRDDFLLSGWIRNVVAWREERRSIARVPEAPSREMQASDCDCKTPLLDASRTVRHSVDLRPPSESSFDHLRQVIGC